MQTPCTHPPARLFAWFAYDGTLCTACCDCGDVLTGAARLPSATAQEDTHARPAHRLDLPDTRRPARGRLEHLVETAQAPAVTRPTADLCDRSVLAMAR